MTHSPTPGPLDLASPPDPAAVASGIAWGDDGLVAGVVQDAGDGRVLMVGWLDAEALAATLTSGEVHFHSRSRGRLWRKGESSGNVLALRGLSLDCDGDALLLAVEPAGPTCHRGTRSCFDPDGARDVATDGARDVATDVAPDVATDVAADGARDAEPSGATGALPAQGQGFAWLETLWSTIEDRAARRPGGSYTVRLLDGGVDLAGRKVAEETIEVLLAAKNDEAAERGGADRVATRAAIAGEAADLAYHALVLLAARGIEPRAVLEVLRGRHAGSGPR